MTTKYDVLNEAIQCALSDTVAMGAFPRMRELLEKAKRQAAVEKDAKPVLTDRDHDNLDDFLGHVLDYYKAGVITKEQVVSGLAHTITAIDIGNQSEARQWLEQGRKLIRR